MKTIIEVATKERKERDRRDEGKASTGRGGGPRNAIASSRRGGDGTDRRLAHGGKDSAHTPWSMDHRPSSIHRR